MKRQTTNYEKIFPNRIPDKHLISRGVAQVVENLNSKGKSLSPNPSPAETNKQTNQQTSHTEKEAHEKMSNVLSH
jgi:hypothetical protein